MSRTFMRAPGPSIARLREEPCEWCHTVTRDIEGTYMPADGAIEWECGSCGRLSVTVLDLEDTDV